MVPHSVPLVVSLVSKCTLILLCMLAHELGHILVARFYHVPVKKIGFNRFGMYIQRSRVAGWPEIATCLAGAAMNLTLAVLFWNVDNWFALCNFTFALVNCLPITNSDGSHALDAFRAMHRAPAVQPQRIR
jgi:Zn-dependent protease